jgi:hypothetical protein
MFGDLDAGSGRMIVAALAGGLAGIVVLVKLYWNRFLGIFSKKRRSRAEDLSSELVPKSADDQ